MLYIHRGDPTIHEAPDGTKLDKSMLEVTGADVYDADGNPISGVVIDPKTGIASFDLEMHVDMEADPVAKRAAHAVKAAEAAFVASGYTLTAGLLYEEALATGIGVGELAATVLEQAAPEREDEVRRRVAKKQAREA